MEENIDETFFCFNDEVAFLKNCVACIYFLKSTFAVNSFLDRFDVFNTKKKLFTGYILVRIDTSFQQISQ